MSEFITVTSNGVSQRIRYSLISVMRREGEFTFLISSSGRNSLPYVVDQTPEQIEKLIREANHG